IAPAVDDQMVIGPNELVRVCRDADQREPHQRRVCEVEALLTLRFEILVESLLLLGWSQLPPVELVQTELDLPIDDLHRFVEPFPHKARAQNRVSLDHSLPRLLESRNVQISAQRAVFLNEIHTAFRFVKTVKQNSVLNW